jgi:hypothetical protein
MQFCILNEEPGAMKLKIVRRATSYLMLPGFFLCLVSVVVLALLCLDAPAYRSTQYDPSFKPLPASHLSSLNEKSDPVTLEIKQRRWWPTVRKLSRRYNLDPALVMAVIQVESSFDHRAVSHKGAQGLMQIIPLTAVHLGLKNPMDPKANLRAGIRYLAQLKKAFKGDMVLTLAAYNAGPTKVAALGTVPDHQETRDFVVKVLSLADRFRARFQSLALN